MFGFDPRTMDAAAFGTSPNIGYDHLTPSLTMLPLLSMLTKNVENTYGQFVQVTM